MAHNMSKRQDQHNPNLEDEQPTAFRLDPERMAELIAIGSNINNSNRPADAEQEQEKASLLYKRLEEKLPPDSSDLKVLSECLGQMRNTIGILASETIGELLESPNTGQDVMRKIKDHFKSLSKTAKSEADYEKANIVYYAAIAHALVYHEEKITQFSCEELTQYLDFLTRQEWIPRYLIDLFRKARKKCRDKK